MFGSHRICKVDYLANNKNIYLAIQNNVYFNNSKIILYTYMKFECILKSYKIQSLC